jgi:hypothetical protein
MEERSMPKTRTEPVQTVTIEVLQDADWVLQMRDHFSQTGAFRVEDVNRILGDPSEHVDASVDSDKEIGSKLLNF